MKKTIKLFTFFTTLLILIACSDSTKSPEPYDPYEGVLTELTFKNVQTKLEKPSKVKYFFSLRDQDDHAVVIPERSLRTVQVDIYEDSLLVDKNESPRILHLGSDAKMDIMLVMDFTESMVASGALLQMIDGATSIINTLSENHRVAIYEFHDSNPNSNYSLIQDFTYDKDQALKALDDFTTAGTYHGFSQCWDAVLEGLQLFTPPVDHDKINALVFLSDGHNVNSVNLPDAIAENALDKDVRLYTIGTGSTTATDAAILDTLSTQTGGEYYLAPDLKFLEDKFKLIIADLGGNYTLSYTSPSTNPFVGQATLTWLDVTTEPAMQDTFEITDYVDNDRIGLLRFSSVKINEESIDFNVYTDHVPRGITSFSFGLDISHDADVTINTVGGLLENWNVPVKQSSGLYHTGGTELNFGDYGFLMSISIAKNPEQLPENVNLGIGFIINNSVYDYDVKFLTPNGTEFEESNKSYCKEYFVLGTQSLDPNPRNLSRVNFGLLNEGILPLQWQVQTQRPIWRYEVLADSLPPDSTFITPQTVIATDLAVSRTNLEVNTPSPNGTDYYWRVRLYDLDDNEILGPIWKFELYKEEF